MTTVSDFNNKLKPPQTSVAPDVQDDQIIVKSVERDIDTTDLIYESSIQRNTDKLIAHLNVCNGFVDAAFHLRKYVPDTINNDQDKLWKEQIIPNMLKLVSQDIKARSSIIHAFGAVLDLAIVIQKVSQLMDESDGSETAIAVARKDIPAALAKLDQFIEITSNVDMSAVNSFVADSEVLFHIIGEEAGNFGKRSQEIEVNINKLYDQQNELCQQYVTSVGEANRDFNLYHATKQYLEDEKASNEALKEQILEFEKKNQSIETEIEEIESTAVVDVVENRSMFRFRKSSTITSMAQQKNLEERRRHYQEIIIARMERLNLKRKSNQDSQERIQELIASVDDFKTKYDVAKQKSGNLKVQLDKKMEEWQKQIDYLSRKLEELKDEQDRIESKIGLTGSTLMQCLVHIHRFLREISDGSNAYAPIVLILKGIKAIVQSDIDMLSGSVEETSLSVCRLRKSVGFIFTWYDHSSSAIELTHETQQLSITHSETNN